MTDKVREAAQQALEALEWTSDLNSTAQNYRPLQDSIAAIRAALAEPVQEPKPVAWWKRHRDGSVELNEARTFITADALATGRRPLVFGDTVPPQRQPLSDDRTERLIRIYDGGNSEVRNAMRGLKQAIEAAHGITGENT